MKSVAKQQADQCEQALVSGDFDRVATFTYPKVIDLEGGKDAMIRSISNTTKQLRFEGLIIKTVEIGDIEKIESFHSQEFAVVPTVMELMTPKGILRAQSYLLGVSDDGGRIWKFVDGSGMKSGRDIHTVVANFPPDLSLPLPVKPMLGQGTAAPAVVRLSDSPGAMTIDRDSYSTEVPEGSKVHGAASGKLSADRYTAVELPSGHNLVFMVVMRKETAVKLLDDLTGDYMKKLQSSTMTTSDAFDGRNGTGRVVTGLLNGVKPFCFELGTFAGQRKAFVIMCSYDRDDPTSTKEALHHAIASFLIKE